MEAEIGDVGALVFLRIAVGQRVRIAEQRALLGKIALKARLFQLAVAPFFALDFRLFVIALAAHVQRIGDQPRQRRGQHQRRPPDVRRHQNHNARKREHDLYEIDHAVEYAVDLVLRRAGHAADEIPRLAVLDIAVIERGRLGRDGRTIMKPQRALDRLQGVIVKLPAAEVEELGRQNRDQRQYARRYGPFAPRHGQRRIDEPGRGERVDQRKDRDQHIQPQRQHERARRDGNGRWEQIEHSICFRFELHK